MSITQRVRQFCGLLAGLMLANNVLAACGQIPATYPVMGASTLVTGANVRVGDGTMYPVSSTTTSTFTTMDPANGNLVTWRPSLPSIPVSTFPANSSTTNLTTGCAGTTVNAGSYATVTISANTPCGDPDHPSMVSGGQFTGGTYYIQSLVIQSGTSEGPNVVHLAPGDYYIGSLSVESNVQFIIDPPSPVRFFLNDSISGGGAGITGSNVVWNANQNAGNLQMYLFPGTAIAPRTITFGANTAFNGVLMAPGVYDTIATAPTTSTARTQLSGSSLVAGALNLGAYTDVIAPVSIGGATTCFSAIASAEYRMDDPTWAGTGTAKDSSGNGYNGTPTNGATTSMASPVVAGSPGTCGYGVFNPSSNQSVDLPSAVPHLAANFTVGAWIRTTDNTKAGQHIYFDDQNGTGWFFTLGDSGAGTIEIDMPAATPSKLATGNLIANNGWYYVAASVDVSAGTRSLYVFNQSGTLIGTAGPQSFSAADFVAGEGSNNGNQAIGDGFKGNIDELRIFTGALTASDLSNFILTTRPCSAVNHVAISTAGTSSTCDANAVTVTLHDSIHNTISNSGATITLTTSDGVGDWALTAGSGTLNNGTANDGVATYTFAANESTVGLSLTHQASGTITIGVTETATGNNLLAATPAGELNNSMIFTPGTLMITATAGGAPLNIANLAAGQASPTYYITAKDASCQPLSGTQTVKFGYQCVNPTSCISSSRAIVNGTTLTSGVSNGTTPSGTYQTSVSLNFTGGSAPFTFSYPDVGQIKFYMNLSAQGTTAWTNPFVVKPGNFILSNIKRTSNSAANPAAADATGGKFVKAGESFTATVTATTVGGAPTPNYGNESPSENVALIANLVAPVGGHNPGVSGNFPAPGASNGFNDNGQSTGSAFSWNEVGIITLQAHVSDGDYLGAGDTIGTASGNVGRFYAAALDMQSPSVVNRADSCPLSGGCPSAFTYMGEQAKLSFTLIPVGADGSPLQNYTGQGASTDFAKIDPTVFANLGIGAVDRTTTPPGSQPQPPYYLSGRISNSGMPAVTCSTNPCFKLTNVLGIMKSQAVVTVPFTLTRGAVADGAYNATQIGIAPVDADGALLDSYDLNADSTGGNDHGLVGSMAWRYGRIKVANMFGSERLPLVVPMTLEYYDYSSSGSWIPSVGDNVTKLLYTDIALTGWTGTTAAKNFPSGSTSVTTTPSTLSFVNGVGSFKLTAPGAGKNGAVNATAGSIPFLPSTTGKENFGAYKGNKEVIHFREIL